MCEQSMFLASLRIHILWLVSAGNTNLDSFLLTVFLVTPIPPCLEIILLDTNKIKNIDRYDGSDKGLLRNWGLKKYVVS